jgi:hypothetical protein
MPTRISGDDVILTLGQGGSYANYYALCNRGLNINRAVEMVEVTGLSSDATEFLPTYKGGTIDFDNVLVYKGVGETGAFDAEDIENWFENKTLLEFVISRPAQGGERTTSGYCYISSLSVSGSYNEAGVVSASLQITGEVTYL